VGPGDRAKGERMEKKLRPWITKNNEGQFFSFHGKGGGGFNERTGLNYGLGCSACLGSRRRGIRQC